MASAESETTISHRFRPMLPALLKSPRRSDVALRLINFFVQRLVGLNADFPHAVHFTSRVVNPQKLRYHPDDETLRSFARSAGCYFQPNNGIYLGRRVLIGPGVKIISANHRDRQVDAWQQGAPVEIGDDCWIGANAVILPGVRLGARCIVGAGAIVTQSFDEPDLIIGGNPARVIRRRSARATCEEEALNALVS
ncbi:MAG: DapH/DapD/GlmU-related protein [Verrucomicrobiota bacterium JB022]|nr:DapH/DapD/GlmU-related protein [Verrucomicrobiota bacterium JB022]